MFCSNRARIKSVIAASGFNLYNSRRSACIDRQSRLLKSIASCLLLLAMLTFSTGSALAQEGDWYPKLTRDLEFERLFAY